MQNCYLFQGKIGKLFDQLFRLEKLPEVEDLPCGQTQEAAHGEQGEIEDTGVGGFIGIPHFLLSLPHVCKILDNRLTEIFQPFQLNLQRFQLSSISKVLIIFGFNSMLSLQENLVPAPSHVTRYSRNEANLEHVIVIGGEGKLALVSGLPVDEVLPLSVSDHHVHLLPRNLINIIFSSHKNSLVNLFLQTFSCVRLQMEHQGVNREDKNRAKNQT